MLAIHSEPRTSILSVNQMGGDVLLSHVTFSNNELYREDFEVMSKTPSSSFRNTRHLSLDVKQAHALIRGWSNRGCKRNF
jgi:hypothetical protein